MHYKFKLFNILFFTSIFCSAINAEKNNYEENNYNEYITLSEISALKDGNLSDEVRQNITKYIVNNLIKNQKQLAANLPKITDLLALPGGIQITDLNKDLKLITMQTFLGPYQTNGVFLIYDLKNIKLSLIPFSDTNNSLENSLDFKVLENNFVQFNNKSRGIGDCGNISTYQYIDNVFKLYKQREFACS
jgi:hypothetical protein